MSLSELRESIQDFAKDTRLNLGSVLSETGAPGLSERQIWGVALSCAFATKSSQLIEALLTESAGVLSKQEVEAAKAAAAIMAMNNVYYRTMHLLEEQEIARLPARLRMNIIANHGIQKADFEMYCVAVSAIAGCGACINSHVKELIKAGVSQEGIHSSIRIASVIQATSLAIALS